MDTIKVFNNGDEIAHAALDYVLKAARKSITARGVFNIALAGGSTPKKLYGLLAKEPGIDWANWQFFMGDERYVPTDNENSNQKMADETLLSKISITPVQIHPVPVTEPTAEQTARLYEKQMEDYFPEPIPTFDLILLGMGSDAHTASLFPGKPALEERRKLVVASPPGVLPPPVNRVTFTFPLINAARKVLFLTAGTDKAEAFEKVRQDLRVSPEKATTPAGKVRPASGELRWFVDKAAAGS